MRKRAGLLARLLVLVFGMPATAWLFRQADRAAVLFCRAADPPADAWRSIAETFEFLPE